MTARLAICLLTADRPEYTRKTLESLCEHNQLRGHFLVHADDASSGHENLGLATEYGFKTVYYSKKRQGQGEALRRMWEWVLSNTGATHILHLENDWECVGKLPEPGLFDMAWLDKPDTFGQTQVYEQTPQSVRLYGQFKERDGGPRSMTGPHIIGTKEVIRWKRLEHTAFGRFWDYASEASWGGPPSITEAKLLYEAAQGGGNIKEISKRLARLRTLRPAWGDNVMWHIGEKQTPNFNGTK